MLRLWPELKVRPYPEPNVEIDEENHRKWRREYPQWKDTIKCPCGKGYFCRKHGEWVRGSEAFDKYQRERDQYGYPNCPPWHTTKESHDGKIEHGDGYDPTLYGEEDFAQADDSGLGQDFEGLDLGRHGSIRYPYPGQDYDHSLVGQSGGGDPLYRGGEPSFSPGTDSLPQYTSAYQAPDYSGFTESDTMSGEMLTNYSEHQGQNRGYFRTANYEREDHGSSSRTADSGRRR